MNILILDDDQWRHDKITRYMPIDYEVTSVFNITDFIVSASAREYDYIFLDHDLGLADGVEWQGGKYDNSGIAAVEFLLCHYEPNYSRLPQVFVHSANPPAAKLMAQKLEDHGFTVIQMEHSRLMEIIHFE